MFRNEWADVSLRYVVVWNAIVFAFWTLVLGWPGRPRTLVGGLLLAAWVLLVAVPYAWAAKRFGNPLFSNRLARQLAARTGCNASGARVTYLTCIVLATMPIVAALVIVLHYGTAWLFGQVPAIPAFLDRHVT